MNSVFTMLSDQAKATLVTHYRSYLHQKDGAVDYDAGTIQAKEDLLVRYASLGTHVDSESISESYQRLLVDRDVVCSTRTALWMAAMARFGSDLSHVSLRRFQLFSISGGGVQEILAHVHLQHVYHARYIERIFTLLGTNKGTHKWGSWTKSLDVLAHVPNRFVFLMMLATSVSAVVFLNEMRRVALRLFDSGDPADLAILHLFDQILIDEVGHVTFALTQLGRLQVGIARGMIPAFARGLAGNEYTYELFDIRSLMNQIKYLEWGSVSHEILKQAFVADRALKSKS